MIAGSNQLSITPMAKASSRSMAGSGESWMSEKAIAAFSQGSVAGLHRRQWLSPMSTGWLMKGPALLANAHGRRHDQGPSRQSWCNILAASAIYVPLMATAGPATWVWLMPSQIIGPRKFDWYVNCWAEGRQVRFIKTGPNWVQEALRQ